MSRAQNKMLGAKNSISKANKSKAPRSFVEEFMDLASGAEGILTQYQVPCNVPLLLSDARSLTESRFKGAVMTAVAAGVETEEGWAFSEELQGYEAAAALEELEQKESVERGKGGLVENEVACRSRPFEFFLPQRLACMLAEPAALAEINAEKYLGKVLGVRNKSLCIVMSKLAKTKKRVALKRKKVASKHEEEAVSECESEIHEIL